MSSMGRKVNQGARIAWILGASVALIMIIGVADLPAQSSVNVEEIFSRPIGPLPPEAYSFIGNWTRDGQSYSRGDCGFLVDQNGIPRNNCAIIVDEMPLSERALAWIEYFDEIQSPLYSCGANTIPTLLGDVLKFQTSLKRDHIFIYYEMGGVERKVWIDGRPHPPEGEQFYQGHAIGRFVDDGLVIHTANFTFDPSGFDDHGHIATSVEKKVTEYYTFTNPNRVDIEITVEDPQFLTAPYTFHHYWIRTDEVMDGHWECDADSTRREVYYAYEEKYLDDTRNAPRIGSNDD